MKQSPKSVKVIKGIFLVIGLFLLLQSGTFDELSSKEPDNIKFLLGMLFIGIALLKRIRLFIKDTFDC